MTTRTPTRLGWTLALLLLELTVGLVLFSSATLQEQTALEGRWIRQTFGEATAQVIRERADRCYERVVMQTHLKERLHASLIPTEEQRRHSKGLEHLGSPLWPWIETRIEALTDWLYWLFRRVHLFALWVPVCLPAMGIAVINGWYDRKIKQTNFAYTSPALHLYSWRAVNALVTGTLLSFIFPLAVPPVLYPTVLLAVMLLLGVVMGNMVKRL